MDTWQETLRYLQGLSWYIDLNIQNKIYVHNFVVYMVWKVIHSKSDTFLCLWVPLKIWRMTQSHASCNSMHFGLYSHFLKIREFLSTPQVLAKLISIFSLFLRVELYRSKDFYSCDYSKRYDKRTCHWLYQWFPT